jgi:hypothetical protein
LNAELVAPDTPRPPLWPELARAMAERLYSANPSAAPRDPLRLAEEYWAYLGQVALDEFIRNRICDSAWRPGELHKRLLKLPWSDVLTTNWDTLLERASRDVSGRHDATVCTAADLAHASPPRITKLHGSRGSNENFIVATEDYPTYPLRFAPFVNFVRQSLIENELCLLGFSGDDPNFLQWTGWVRGELVNHARRVYRVGVLDLSAAKRKLLEARNVAPIDLAPLVAAFDDDAVKHREATRLVLAFLTQAKPIPTHEWMPAPRDNHAADPAQHHHRLHRDPPYAAQFVDAAVDRWRHDRKSYPGWLICPPAARSALRHATDDVPWPSDEALANLSQERRSQFLYELSWRHVVSIWPIGSWLFRQLETIAAPDSQSELTQQQKFEVAIALVGAARKSGNNAAFQKWTTIARAAATTIDAEIEIDYQRALEAGDRLDLPNALMNERLVRGTADPVWRLRQAALLSERAEIEAVRQLLTQAVHELDVLQRGKPGSLWVRSRRAWAHFLLRAAIIGSGADVQPVYDRIEFEQVRSDPRRELATLADEISSTLRKQIVDRRQIVPLFKAGHYKDTSRSTRFQSVTVVSPAFTVQNIAEDAGAPLRINYVNILEDLIRDTLVLDDDSSYGDVSWYRRLLRTVSSPSDTSQRMNRLCDGGGSCDGVIHRGPAAH